MVHMQLGYFIHKRVVVKPLLCSCSSVTFAIQQLTWVRPLNDDNVLYIQKIQKIMPTSYSKYRILISFGAVIVLMVIVAAMGLMRMAENNRGMETIVEEHNVKTRLLVEMHSAGRERSIILLRMLNTEDPFDRDDDYLKFNKLAFKFIQARQALSSMPLDNQELVLLGEQGMLTNEAEPLQERAIQLLFDDAAAEASDLILNHAIPAQDKVMSKLVEMLEQQQRSAREAMFISNKSYRQTVVAISILSVFAIGVAILVAYFVMRKTTQAENILFNQVHEERKLRRQLSHQASHDALTGLINRFEFETRLRRLLENAQLEKTTHALVYIDLDQFKIVNDTCGHVAGDELLRQLSSMLADNIRSHDTLARLGGDEFGLLLEHCNSDYSTKITNTLLKLVQDFRFVWDDKNFVIGASIGVVIIDANSGNITDMMRVADAACYSAKDAGRNRIHVVQENDTAIADRYGEMQWVTKINDALEEQRFELFSQRIISLNNSTKWQKDMFEVLVRMRDKNGKLVPPGAFIPAAERYNIMIALDRWVISETLMWLAHNQQNLQNLGKCSINVSGSSIGHPEFLDYIKQQLETSKVSAEHICVEITETSAVSNLTDAKQFIAELKAIGCSFALDDFGCGLSSFAYLKNLQVDYLKIDGMFVRDIINNPIDRAMVKSINEIGHVMGKKTIAECVENDEVLALLREIGIDYVQGYGIERPKRLSHIEAMEVYAFGKKRV